MSDDEEDFHREFERARANDHARTGPVRFRSRLAPPDQAFLDAPPLVECPSCREPLNAFGLCRPCRLKRDQDSADALAELSQQTVGVQRKWLEEPKPEGAELASWLSDKRWLEQAGQRLTVQAIEERWAKKPKGRKAREDDR